MAAVGQTRAVAALRLWRTGSRSRSGIDRVPSFPNWEIGYDGTMTHAGAESLIELDERKRVSLSMGRPGRYLAHLEPDGTIVLVPAVVMSELEAALLRDQGIMNQVRGAAARGFTGGRTDRPTRSAR